MKVMDKYSYKYQVNELAFMNSSEYLLQGTSNNSSLEILKFDDMTPLQSLHGHTSSVLSVSVDPNDKYIATGGADALVALWETKDFTCVKSFYHMEHPIRALSFSHDSRYLSMTGEDNCVFVEDIATGHSLGTVELRSVPEESCWNPAQHVLAYPTETYDQCDIELRRPTHT